MAAIDASSRTRPSCSRQRRRGVVGALALAAALPGLLGGGSAALAAPAAKPAVLPRPAAVLLTPGTPAGHGFADVRAAARPGALALRSAQRARQAAGPASRLFGATRTYYALEPDGFGASLVRFNTDGRAHVSRRTVLTPADPGTVVAPTSAVGGTLIAMEAGPYGQNVVSVDSRGRRKRLTNDGFSAFGLLTPSRRVVYVTLTDSGEVNGLAQVDLAGRGKRVIFRERDRDAVLSLPALSASGRTAYLVRNVFDRRGLPQSSLLTIDVASGRTKSRPLPGLNYVVSVAVSPNGRDLAVVGYRAADNIYARWIGFRAEADVLGTSSGSPRRVAWVQDPFVVFSRGSSRLVVGADNRLVSVAVSGPHRDQMYGTEGLSLPVLAR